MYTYALLETGCYYLIQEKINSPISLIRPSVESDQCLFINRYDDPLISEWKKKTDPIHEIIECLSDDAVHEWEKYYNSNEDAYYEEDDDE